MKTVLALALAALFLPGCSESPQRLDTAAAPGYRTDDWQDQQRARTLRQSESTRIY